MSVGVTFLTFEQSFEQKHVVLKNQIIILVSYWRLSFFLLSVRHSVSSLVCPIVYLLKCQLFRFYGQFVLVEFGERKQADVCLGIQLIFHSLNNRDMDT